MTREFSECVVIGTLAEAIDRALEDLDAAGVRRPAGLTGANYSLPNHD